MAYPARTRKKLAKHTLSGKSVTRKSTPLTLRTTFRMPRNAMKRLLALSIKAVRPN